MWGFFFFFSESDHKEKYRYVHEAKKKSLSTIKSFPVQLGEKQNKSKQKTPHQMKSIQSKHSKPNQSLQDKVAKK